MNVETAEWARSYRTALRRYLRSDTLANSPTALKLGRRAVTLGMETLDVVRIHEQAIMTLTSPSVPLRILQETIKRANAFFAEVIVPIEKTHRATPEADVRVNRLTQTLRRRTLALAVTDRLLKDGVRRRQIAEEALNKSRNRQTRRLMEARSLQRHLRRIMREILLAHEDKRRKTSRHLYNKVSQTLLGIHVRLLTLKTVIKNNSENLQKEIDETKRRVDHFRLSFHGRTRKFKGHHET